MRLTSEVGCSVQNPAAAPLVADRGWTAKTKKRYAGNHFRMIFLLTLPEFPLPENHDFGSRVTDNLVAAVSVQINNHGTAASRLLEEGPVGIGTRRERVVPARLVEVSSVDIAKASRHPAHSSASRSLHIRRMRPSGGGLQLAKNAPAPTSAPQNMGVSSRVPSLPVRSAAHANSSSRNPNSQKREFESSHHHHYSVRVGVRVELGLNA